LKLSFNDELLAFAIVLSFSLNFFQLKSNLLIDDDDIDFVSLMAK